MKTIQAKMHNSISWAIFAGLAALFLFQGKACGCRAHAEPAGRELSAGQGGSLQGRGASCRPQAPAPALPRVQVEASAARQHGWDAPPHRAAGGSMGSWLLPAWGDVCA